MPLRLAPRALRHTVAVAAAAVAVTVVSTGAASARTGVDASRPRGLAENVVLSFTSEPEAADASTGLTGVHVVLPQDLRSEGVVVNEVPPGWKYAPTADGYTVSGRALPPGAAAEHRVTVRQLPEAPELLFATVETYAGGREVRWDGEPGRDGTAVRPAAVLRLGPAARGAEPVRPEPAPAARPESALADGKPRSAPSPAAAARESGNRLPSWGTGALAVALVLVPAAGMWWRARRRADGAASR